MTYPDEPATALPVTPPKRRRRRWPWIVGGVVAVFLVIGALNSKTPDAAPAAAAAAAPVAAQPVAAAPAPAGLSCAGVGGEFVAHGTDGRGDCMSADPRPKCHIAPAQQDGNYIAELTMTPPFPGGTIDNPELIAAASNKGCWKMSTR